MVMTEGVTKFKAITIYHYHDGAVWFTAQSVADAYAIYMFRWSDGPDDPDDRPRTYKADGYDVTVTEDEIDWSEAKA